MANQNDWGIAPYTIQLTNGQVFSITVSGRDRWALEELINAGTKGCTPINNPAPRWSGYIYNLRKYGVPIETFTEAHDGPFSGTHARYLLGAVVTRTEGVNA